MNSDAKDVMTVADLCAYLQLSEANVREMLRRGKIPAVIIGRQWRIRKAAIDEWLVTQEQTRPAYRRRPPREPDRLGTRKPPSEPAPAEVTSEERNRMAREALERDRPQRRGRGRA